MVGDQFFCKVKLTAEKKFQLIFFLNFLKPVLQLFAKIVYLELQERKTLILLKYFAYSKFFILLQNCQYNNFVIKRLINYTIL
jgi:hypothetical protein